MRTISVWLFSLALLPLADASAKPLSLLFIGNSYTYIPEMGEPESPALPRLVAAIARSIDPELEIKWTAHTVGGYSLENHFHDLESMRLLSGSYDKVLLQAQSTDTLEMTPWWAENTRPGVKSFSVYLPKILKAALKNNRDVTLYVNWGWNAKHVELKEDHPGLRFPPGHPREGQRWAPDDKHSWQDRIDSAFERYAQGFPVKLSKVGRAWIELQDAGLVAQDELYIHGDWSHASPLGAYIAALVLVRDVLELDIRKTVYTVPGISAERARRIAEFLYKSSCEKKLLSATL